MTRMTGAYRLTARAAVVIWTCTLASIAQAEESEDIGVLLGISHPALETIWVTFQDGSPRIAARGPGILVPRDGAFWWVGVASADAASSNWYDTFLWASPGGVSTNLSPLSPPVRDYVDDLVRFGGVRDIGIVFVGPDYVSVEESFEVHGPHIAYNHAINVFAIETLAEPSVDDRIFMGLPMESVLGSNSADALDRGAAEAAKQDDEFADESFIAYASKDWGIRRERGRFRIVGRAGYSTGAARGYYVDFDVPYELPEHVAGASGRAVPWFWAQEEAPDAVDVLGSPSGRTVLLSTRAGLHVYEADDTGLGERLATLPIHLGGLVMAQWAQGEQVDRWSQRIDVLLRDGPPKP